MHVNKERNFNFPWKSSKKFRENQAIKIILIKVRIGNSLCFQTDAFKINAKNLINPFCWKYKINTKCFFRFFFFKKNHISLFTRGFNKEFRLEALFISHQAISLFALIFSLSIVIFLLLFNSTFKHTARQNLVHIEYWARQTESQKHILAKKGFFFFC